MRGGCGSSREHAPWAIQDYGFAAVIAHSFGDIFRNNCYKNGILPVVLSEDIAIDLMRQIEAQDGYKQTIDLESQNAIQPDGLAHPFEIRDFQKQCLLNGLDEIGWTFQFESLIAEYESRREIY